MGGVRLPSVWWCAGRHVYSGAFGGEDNRACSRDAGPIHGDHADLAVEATHRSQARSVPISLARPSAMRMIAPSTASIHVELMLDSVRMLMTSARRITPVRAPTTRPRPPSSELPPVTAAA